MNQLLVLVFAVDDSTLTCNDKQPGLGQQQDNNFPKKKRLSYSIKSTKTIVTLATSSWSFLCCYSSLFPLFIPSSSAFPVWKHSPPNHPPSLSLLKLYSTQTVLHGRIEILHSSRRHKNISIHGNIQFSFFKEKKKRLRSKGLCPAISSTC